MRSLTPKKRLAVLFVCLLALLLPVVPGFAQDKQVEWPKTLVMSTPMGGGPLQLVTQGIAQFIEKSTPIERVILQPMGGPKIWMPRMRAGEVDMAVHSGPDILNAMYARDNYEGAAPATFVRTLMPGHVNHFVITAVPSANIKSISDLKGKNCFIRDPGNPMFELMTNVILASAGMTQKDLKNTLTRVNASEAASDLIEGRADANIGTIIPIIMMEVQQAKGDVTVIGLTDEERAAAKLPEGYFFSDIQAKSPEFQNPRLVRNSISFKTNLYCSSKMPPELAYALAKLLVERKAEWEPINVLAKQWGVLTPDLPVMHPGAERFFKEAGLWTPEVDAWMKVQAGHLSAAEKK